MPTATARVRALPVRTARPALLPGLLIVLALAAGCRRDEPAPDGPAAAAAPDPAAPGGVEPTAEQADGAAAAAAEPEEIYFDLTAYDWYRQGQPLVHGGQRYLPQGDPRPVPADRLQRVDTYQGVNFYALDGDPEPLGTVYVPVFHGYWQPFVAQAAGAPGEAPGR
jgi:hypothetical protein